MTSLTRVPFHGGELLAVGGATPAETLVLLRPIAERLGLDWSGQRAKIAAHAVLGPCVELISAQVGGQSREVAALPVTMLPFWLAGIQPGRIPNADVRALVLRYQREAASVLFKHFFGGQPAAPGTAASVAPGLTASTVGGVTKAAVNRALADHLVPLGVDLAEQRTALAALGGKMDRLLAAVGGKVQDPTPAPACVFNSALVFLIDLGWPQRGRRAMVNAVSGRLAWFSAEHGYPTRLTAERGIRLFHVDAIAAWRRGEGDAYLATCRRRLNAAAA